MSENVTFYCVALFLFILSLYMFVWSKHQVNLVIITAVQQNIYRFFWEFWLHQSTPSIFTWGTILP